MTSNCRLLCWRTQIPGVPGIWATPAGDAMYSSMVVLKDGRVAILYETGGTLTLGRFSLGWLGD